jgi:hypothetical protein
MLADDRRASPNAPAYLRFGAFDELAHNRAAARCEGNVDFLAITLNSPEFPVADVSGNATDVSYAAFPLNTKPWKSITYPAQQPGAARPGWHCGPTVVKEHGGLCDSPLRFRQLSKSV